MAIIKPFQAIRPKKGLESQIAALPYDVYNREEAKKVVADKPYSFLRIDRAETQFDDTTDTYAECVYQKAHDLLWGMIQQGDFVQDEKPCYYIYELEMLGRKQTGIVACASVDDYLKQIIKKHENTRAEKELDRIHHVESCEAQTGPIFLAYRNQKAISSVIEHNQEKEPIYHFTSEDGIVHTVWIIDDKEEMDIIEKGFLALQEIYIADGHHRCASAVKVGLHKREANPNYTGTEEFNYFLSVLFPDDQLMIMDYNRVIKDLNGMSVNAFLDKLKTCAEVECLGAKAQKPTQKYQVTMFLEDNWYLLTLKDCENIKDPVKSLAVSLLQDRVLEPILGIQDPKIDQRIDFVGGIRGLEELEKRVHSDCKVAFAMYPTSIHELFEVADAGMLMPPKSTWFEPKLRSGLFVHSIR